VVLVPGQAAMFSLPSALCCAPRMAKPSQDCELAGRTGWRSGCRACPSGAPPRFWATILYGHHPFCQQVLVQYSDFLFTCLAASRATLYEWVSDWERVGALGSASARRCSKNVTREGSWDALFDFMLEGLKPVPRKASPRMNMG
jgi:hypothetical protein